MDREQLEGEILEPLLPPQEKQEAHAVLSAGQTNDDTITCLDKVERLLGSVEALDEPKNKW
jgi:hypothetical protein